MKARVFSEKELRDIARTHRVNEFAITGDLAEHALALRGALKPLAVAGVFDGFHKDTTINAPVTVGDVRRARALLATGRKRK